MANNGQKECPQCGGSHKIVCPRCKGKGKIKTKYFNLTIAEDEETIETCILCDGTGSVHRLECGEKS